MRSGFRSVSRCALNKDRWPIPPLLVASLSRQAPLRTSPIQFYRDPHSPIPVQSFCGLTPACGLAPLATDARLGGVTRCKLFCHLLARTFQVIVGTSSGSCFSVDVDGREYFVSAPPMCSPTYSPTPWPCSRRPGLLAFAVRLIGRSPDADTVVFAADRTVAPPLTLDVSQPALPLGAELFFLGFPYGLAFPAFGLSPPFPIPLVKRALPWPPCSSRRNGSPSTFSTASTIAGFSGGPVVYQPPNTTVQHVVALISAYRTEIVAVHDSAGPTPLTVAANTGLILSFAVGAASRSSPPTLPANLAPFNPGVVIAPLATDARR